MRYGSKQEIRINSIPQGAEVRINNQYKGVTPLDLKVSRLKPLRIEYTHPDYGKQYYVVPKKKHEHTRSLALDMVFWIGPLNLALLTDILTGALLEIDQSAINPDLSNKSLFYKNHSTYDSIKTNNKIYRHDSLVALNKEKERLRDSLDQLRKLARKKELVARNLLIRSTLKNEVSWELARLVYQELNFSYTRYIKKGQVGLGLELGYKPPSSTTTHYNNLNELNINGSTTAMMLMPFTDSKYIGILGKFYFEKQSVFNMYFSFVGYYRSSYFNNARVEWNDQVDRREVLFYSDSLNLLQTTKGLKLIYGVNIIQRLNNHMAFVIDLYAGIGLRSLKNTMYHYDYKYYNNKTGLYTHLATNQEEVKTFNTPFFHAGLKIGLRF